LEASECEIRIVDLANGQFVVKQGHFQFRATPTSCECNWSTAIMIPCAHICAIWLRQTEKMPIHLIGARWFVQPVAIPEPDLDLLTFDDLNEMTPGGSGSDTEEVEAPSIVATGKVLGPKMHQVYDRFHKLGKTAASIATQLRPEQQEVFYGKIKMLIEEARPSEVDIGDAMAKQCGRPRKASNSKPHPGGSACPLCGAAHVLHDCTHYPVVQEVKVTWQPREGTGRRCGLCLLRGHTRTSCPVLHEARKRLQK
jgi:hypothetical protein